MASKVKGPSAPTSSTGSAAPQPTGPVQATPSAKAPPAPSDSFARAAQGLFAYKSSPLASGAMKIFGDSVILPPNLTDPNNPANDPKYLRLLSAVLGLDELERYFVTMDEKKQAEYLERKEKRRQEILEEKKQAKEEKRREEDKNA